MSDTSRAFPLLASLLATLVSPPAAARALVVYPPPQSESAFEDCFVRNYDDSIVVKALYPDARDVEDVTVRRCVVWYDWGFSLGMTCEARVANIRRLRFQDCDVLHGMACRGALGLKNGDPATVSDVRFEDVRVEDARVQLLELVIDRDM